MKISHMKNIRNWSISHIKFSFHIWNGNLLTCKIPNSHVKWTGSKFHMWNIGAQNMYFTYEMGIFSHMKYLIQMWNELVQNFTCEILVFETWIPHMKCNLHVWKLISQTKFSFHMRIWKNWRMNYYFHTWNGMLNLYKEWKDTIFGKINLDTPSQLKWVNYDHRETFFLERVKIYINFSPTG